MDQHEIGGEHDNPIDNISSNDEWQEFYRHCANNLEARGYDEDRANRLGRAQATLLCANYELSKLDDLPSRDTPMLWYNKESTMHETCIVGDLINPNGIIEYDDILVPSWRNWGRALASTSQIKGIRIMLCLAGIELGDNVIEAVAPAFRADSIKALMLRYNCLGRQTVKVAVAILSNSHLEWLNISDNMVESEADALALFSALWEHPTN